MDEYYLEGVCNWCSLLLSQPRLGFKSWALESNYISICWIEKEEGELGPGNSQIYSRSEISELCLAFHPGQTNSNYFYCFHQFGKRYEGTSSDIPYCIRQWQYISQQQKHQDLFDEDFIIFNLLFALHVRKLSIHCS